MNPVPPELLELAREEIGGSLGSFETTVLAVERGTPPPDAVDALFRDAHSIKGTAGMIGLHAVAAVAATLEERLDECRAAGADPAPLTAELLLGVDELRSALDPPAVVAQPAPVARPMPVAEPAAAPARPIRVSAEKVDRMLDAVGETVLQHRRLEHLAGVEADAGERLLSELHDAVIDMRTVPLESITASLPRAVRDLALALQKEVDLVVLGADTQIDRSILEGISDSIVHLVRNSIAHGFERPEERALQGKPRAGRLQLRAGQRGGRVALELSDDGRGVSPELLARAEVAGSLTDLLCAPGFSTAESVTDIAGRGVGLDAVKAQVERLGGSLEVESTPGAGTTVTMLLPLTLALLRVLLCRHDGRYFALPLPSVREVVPVTDTTALRGARHLVLGDESVALVDLGAAISASAAPRIDPPTAMVVSSSSRTIALACDEVIGDEEVVMKSLGPLLAGVEGYLGATILRDGAVALVLDPSHLVRAPVARSAHAAPAPGPAPARTILVVDDQFTVREMQRSILEAAGYRVLTARDGREALGHVTSEPAIEMVLTDVQMPTMDGFDLLRAIRGLPDRSSLPVAIVTSMDAADDRRRGMDEGADAYIVKQEFDQQTLLDTVGRLVRA